MTMKWFPAGMVVAALAVTVFGSPVYAISVYNNRDQFVAEAGAGLQLEDFEGVPLDANGLAVFSNGATFGAGAFSIDSLTFDEDVQLTSSGLMGTFLIGLKGDNPNINRQLLPGGGGGRSDPGDDDDLKITFAQPLRAFGMLVIENRREPDERVFLKAADGREVLSLPLAGGTSGVGSNGFMGFVASSPLDYIQTIVIEEGQVLNDDIGFTWIYFDPVPEPSSLALFAGLWFGCVARNRRH
jgi:hypothetical protein